MSHSSTDLASSTGPIAQDVEARLTAALQPTRLVVTDDSEAHRGHGGHDARGESHFSVEVESPLFVGIGRVQRQRMINAPLADLLADRVHALAIRASAPGE